MKCEALIIVLITMLKSDIDGREDMRRIYGTIVVRKKVKAEREGKVS